MATNALSVALVASIRASAAVTSSRADISLAATMDASLSTVSSRKSMARDATSRRPSAVRPQLDAVAVGVEDVEAASGALGTGQVVGTGVDVEATVRRQLVEVGVLEQDGDVVDVHARAGAR